MTIQKKQILPLALILITLISLFLLRGESGRKLWNGYRVLSVPAESDDTVVLALLSQAGCKDVVALSQQQYPVQSLAPIQNNPSADSYLVRRNAYFYDQTGKFRLYYIPDRCSRELSDAVELLAAEQVPATLDGGSKNSSLIPLVCLVICAVFCFAAKNRNSYLLASLFPLLFAFTSPSYTNAAGVCLVLCAVFFAQSLWKRRNPFAALIKNPVIIICLAVPLVIISLGSLKSAVLYLLMLSATGSMLYLALQHEKKKAAEEEFSPVPILSAAFVPVVTQRKIRYLSAGVCGIVVLTVLFSCSDRFHGSAGKTGEMIPSPRGYAVSSTLPGVDEYLDWAWQSAAFPYENLNSAARKITDGKNRRVVIPRYEETAGGIREYEETALSYNGAFRRNALAQVDKLPYPAVEKILCRQGRLLRPGFMPADAVVQNPFAVYAGLLIAAAVIAGISLLYRIGRRKHAVGI